MVPWDVRLQYRYGFYGVYAVLTVLFAATLRSVPSGAARETALLLVVFSDPSFLGFYFVAVARFDSINAYFMTALAYTSVLGAPVLGLVGIVETPLYYLLPAKPSLVLLEAAVGAVPPAELAYAVGYLLVAIAVASVAARRAFERHVVADVGDPGTDRAPLASGVGGRGGPVAALVVVDLKNWLRDPLLVYIGLAPVLMGAVMRYFVPFATESLRGVLDLAAYYPEVAGALLLFGPAIIGFAVGFLMFEDREQGTVVALTLTPLGGGGYLAYRLLVTLALSLGAALVVVPPSGLVTVRPLALVAAAGGSRPADGQRRRTVDEHALGRFDGASLHGETVEPLEERRYRDGRLQSGERRAETVVGPVSEGDVTARVAVEVERPGVVEDGRVVVRGAKPHAEFLARFDAFPGDSHLRGRVPAVGLDRRTVPERLLDGPLDRVSVGPHGRDEVRFVERPHRVTHEAGHREAAEEDDAEEAPSLGRRETFRRRDRRGEPVLAAVRCRLLPGELLEVIEQ